MQAKHVIIAAIFLLVIVISGFALGSGENSEELISSFVGQWRTEEVVYPGTCGGEVAEISVVLELIHEGGSQMRRTNYDVEVPQGIINISSVGEINSDGILVIIDEYQHGDGIVASTVWIKLKDEILHGQSEWSWTASSYSCKGTSEYTAIRID